ncbi:ISL3 family transposase [Streptomyces hydrogenans]|uniref:ISL3 family transposase n=1 Tax=Streptomyces hydrogenans TaxID=1873719 RepID=UPI00369C3D28
MFSGLPALVIEDVANSGETVQVSARTRHVPVPCPLCGVLTGRAHGYHGRTVRDVPVDGRQVVVRVGIRRLVCPVRDCGRQTFREQVPGLLERHQRRTTRLTGRLSELVKELCGRASARLTRSLAMPVSHASALRLLRRVPLPAVRIPRVIGVDDFALRRRHSYATIIIDAETGRRIEVLPGREAATLEAWLREHPGIEAVCRDGSATYPEAVRRALPDAIQISDRWHLWHNLAEAVRKEVAAHSICWAKPGPPPAEGRQAATTRERRQQVHALRERGVGLLECARRLNLALNTVKRYDRIAEPERLGDHQRERIEAARTACQETTALADLIHGFAALLDVDAALTLPHHKGGTEGVNNKTKLIKRQMYGRASFPLLRHRILLG